MAPLKILVVGRSGMLARCLGELRLSDVAIAAVGRPDLDLLDPDSIARSIDLAAPDVIINAAAYTAVDKAESEPEAAFALNFDGPARLAMAAAHHKIPLIHVSTDYVFDGRKASPYAEDDVPNPLGVYGRSKLAGERIVAELHEQHIIARTSWVHAPVGANFVRTILRLAEIHREVRVVDDQLGNPTYAPHLAASLVAIARAAVRRRDLGLKPWGIYHVAGTGETTWFGLAREILDNAAGLDLPLPTLTAIRTVDYPTAAPRPVNSRLDTERLAQAFGIRLPEWRAGVADCVLKLAGGRSAAVLPHARMSAGGVS